MDREIRIEGPNDPQSASRQATELSRRQFGAITRRQLLAIGFSPTRIRDWLRCERLHPQYTGVYALGRADLSPAGELAAGLLFAGPGASLGSLTALWWRDLLSRRPDWIHLDAPGRSASQDGLRIRHPARVTREMHRGLPVVSLVDALLAAAGALSHSSLRLVLARAEFKRILDLPSLQSATQDGRRGSRVIRAALAAHLPQLARCANGFERDFVLLCERARLPLPEPNERIGRYRPDMLWRDARLIVELDGGEAHSSEAQLAADARRQSDLELMGFTVIRYSWTQVTFKADAVATELRTVLGDRGSEEH